MYGIRSPVFVIISSVYTPIHDIATVLEPLDSAFSFFLVQWNKMDMRVRVCGKGACVRHSESVGVC